MTETCANLTQPKVTVLPQKPERFPTTMKSLLTPILLVILTATRPALAEVIDASKPVKVFILAGQSNMQGHGRITMDKDGDLPFAAGQKQFSYLKNEDGWVERADVWYCHQPAKADLVTSNLKPGLGARPDSIGPELAFGHVIGNHFEEQVLLIKCAWGGQALGGLFRPPGSGNTGQKYTQLLAEVKEALAKIGDHFPAYEGQGYELAGFFWHQGWNDGCKKDLAAEYEKNMTHFVKDVRRDLGNENLPFVIATSGMGGPDATGVAGFLGKSIEPAQVAAAAKFKKCTAVETRAFQKHKPGRQKSHWHNSAESYCLVGDASAKAMIKNLGE
jgi:alpha-galactosidase